MGFSQVWPLTALPKPHKLGSRNKIRLRQPRREESVSKLVSEPGAVAMGSNNSAKLDGPVATALGSDTDYERLG